MNNQLYPFKLEPALKEKIWGGSAIEYILSLYPETPRSNIGEAWLVYDQLVVVNGPLAGKRLAEIIASGPAALLGERMQQQQPGIFPLLFKIIDAKDRLSIQVHPDNAYAQRVENEPFGKCEVWYVFSAEPGAQLVHGLKAPMTAAELGAAIADGTLTDKVQYIDVKAGDVILNLPGTMHAIGSGIVIYEVQQSSDLTYRVFDWARVQSDGTPRALHIDKALDVVKREPLHYHNVQPVLMRQDAAHSCTMLCACDYFAVEKLDVRAPLMSSTANRSFHVLTAVERGGLIRGPGFDPVPFDVGETVLIPASLGDYTIVPSGSGLMLLKSYVPDLVRDIVQPLQANGTPSELIAQLGGDPGDSHLARYL